MGDTEGAATLVEVKALLVDLAARVGTLEEQAARRHPEASDEVLLAISAACAAYLGKRATVKQVHLRRGGMWASQGRAAIQQSHEGLRNAGSGRRSAQRGGLT